MKLNTGFRDFKKKHLKKKHQILYYSCKCNEYKKLENLFKFLLSEKNSFIFESVEKGKTRGRYTIIGLNPDKIWNIIGNNAIIQTNNKKVKIKINPLNYLNRLIKEFSIDIPRN